MVDMSHTNKQTIKGPGKVLSVRGDARYVMGIVGDMSSNPGRDCLHLT